MSTTGNVTIRRRLVWCQSRYKFYYFKFLFKYFFITFNTFASLKAQRTILLLVNKKQEVTNIQSFLLYWNLEILLHNNSFFEKGSFQKTTILFPSISNPKSIDYLLMPIKVGVICFYNVPEVWCSHRFESRIPMFYRKIERVWHFTLWLSRG